MKYPAYQKQLDPHRFVADPQEHLRGEHPWLILQVSAIRLGSLVCAPYRVATMLRSTAVVLTGLAGVALSHNSLMIPTSRNAMDGPAMPDGGASSP